MPRKSTNHNSNTTKNSKRGQTTTQRMKYEIAQDMGVELGPNTSSKQNGTVGGEVTKRLVQKGKTSSKRSSSSR